MDEKMEIVDLFIQFNKYDLALETLQDISEYQPTKEVFLKISKVYEYMKKYDESLYILKSLIKKGEDDPVIYFKIATLYQKKKDISTCFEYLSLAIEKGYNSEYIFYYKGLIYEDQNKLGHALNYYDRSLRKNKSFISSRYRKYLIYLKTNKYNECEEELRKMIKYNGDEYDGYHLLFTFLMNMKRSNEALDILNSAIEVLGKDTIIMLDYAKYYMYINEYDKSIDIINSIPKDNIYYSDFSIVRAKIMASKGDYDEAIKILMEDGIYNEENSEIVYLIGMYSIKLKNYSMAERFLGFLNEAENSDSEFVWFGLYILGYAIKAQDKERSIEYFKKLDEKYKLLSISNPYEIRIMILRIMIMIELQQYDEAITYSEGIMKITTVDEVKELNILAKELKNKRDIVEDEKIIEVVNSILER